MKAEIHPKLNVVQARCSGCGEEFTTVSTREEVSVEICSACHPFWTGKKRMVDTAGRVEKFRQRAAKSGGYGQKSKPKAETPKKRQRED